MSGNRTQRRLAAVLAADIVGYSRLMEADEEGTLVRLKSLRAEVMNPGIEAGGGRIVKTMGDGVLVEFSSAVDAVRAAVDIQQSLRRRNADQREAGRIVFRMGINVGDVIVDGDDIYGDGVNIAARLEGLCEPGSVYVSDNVHDQVVGKVAAVFDDLGPQSVKNISRPVRVYRVRPETAVTAEEEVVETALLLPGKPSIAVLPFENMSADPEQDYFADGITEDIITDLSHISGLFVIARNSSFVYRGRAVSVRQVGGELGVRYVLEGSVRKAGQRVRINAQLIDATSDNHVWAERYDGTLDDVFDLQDEVTRKVVSALAVTLSPSESRSLATDEQSNPEAYDCLLRGRQQYYRFTRDGNVEARHMFERALEIDPAYAPAVAMLSSCYLQAWHQAWSDNPAETLERGGEFAERAVALDDSHARAHAALAHVLIWRRHHDEALAEIDRAIELDPNDAISHGFRCMILSWSGRPAESIPSIETAMRLDPSYEAWMLWALGHAYFGLQRYADAATVLKRGAVRHPEFMPMHAWLALSLLRLDRPEEARDSLAAARRINPALNLTIFRQILPYRDPAFLEPVLSDLREAGLPP